jgi:deoxyribodipyrimidine photolyase-related protein
VELAQFFEGKKRVKTFIACRKKHHVLMENNPVTGKWNYDKENRKSYLKS